MFFIAVDQCVLVHFNLPYKWEVNDGKSWRYLRNMEEIERAYCDPKNERRSVLMLHYTYHIPDHIPNILA